MTAKINTERLTTCIKHWDLSDYSSVLPRIKFRVGGQESSPQSPTISCRRLSYEHVQSKKAEYPVKKKSSVKYLESPQKTTPQRRQEVLPIKVFEKKTRKIFNFCEFLLIEYSYFLYLNLTPEILRLTRCWQGFTKIDHFSFPAK